MVDAELQKQLALWIIRLNCDDAQLRSQAEQEFLQWQQQHPEVIPLIAKMQSLSSDLKQLSAKHHLSTNMVNQSFVHIQDSATKVAKIFKKGLLSLLFFAIGYGLYQSVPWQYYMADYRAQSSQTLPLTLSDGSTIRLGPKSAFNLHYSDTSRQIELLQGSIYVDVAKDPSRPFIVHTEYADFKALGTAFIVYHDDQNSSIDMLHSQVQVRATHVQQPMPAVVVQTGERLSVDEYGIGHVQALDQALLKQSWQQDLILAKDMPLSSLLGRLEPYYAGYFVYNRKQLAGIKINGMIDAKQDVQQSLALIQAKHPQLKITSIGPLLMYLHISTEQ